MSEKAFCWPVPCLIAIILFSVGIGRSPAAQVVGTNALVKYTDNIEWNILVNNNPGHGETVTLNPPRFTWFYSNRWTNDNDLVARQYQFQCAYEPTFASPVVNVRTIFNCYNFIDHFTNSPVFWRVGYIPVTNLNITNWTLPRRFQIASNATIWDRGMFANETFLSNAAVHPHLVFHATNRQDIAQWLSANRPFFFNEITHRAANVYPTNFWWTNVYALETNVWLPTVINLLTPCRFLSTNHLPLSGVSNAGIDVGPDWGYGTNVTAGDRILVMRQNDPAQNGIYVVSSGAWSRATDADAANELVPNVVVTVNLGTTFGRTFQNTGNNLGSGAIRWSAAVKQADQNAMLQDMLEKVNQAAFAWQMTRNPAITRGGYLGQILEYIALKNYSNGWSEIEVFGTGVLGAGLGYGYDWLHDSMTASQRQNVLFGINRVCDHFLNRYWWFMSPGKVGPGQAGKRHNSHAWSSQGMILPTVLAAYYDDPTVRTNFDGLLNYMIGRGNPMGDEEGVDRGRGYGDQEFSSIYLEPWSLLYRTFSAQGWTNHPGPKGFADFYMYFQPVGYRHNGDDPWGDGGFGHPGAPLDQYAKLWRRYAGGRNAAALSRKPEAQLHYQNDLKLDPYINNPDTYFNVTVPYYFPSPGTNLMTNLVRLFKRGGWAFGYTKPPSTLDALSNGVAFMFQARPSSGDNNHTKASDGHFELWAYGAALTSGGGGYWSRYNKKGYAHNSIEVDNVGQETEFWPTRAVKSKIFAFREEPNFVYAAADLTSNYIHHATMTRVHRHFLFVRQKYFVVFDDLKSRANSTWTWIYHIQEPTLGNLSASGFRYACSNLYGGPGVTSVVQHIGMTNLLGVKRVDRGATWTDPTWGVFFNPITTHPFTGQTNENGYSSAFRSHALYYTNSVPAANWHFMTVIYPVKTGEPLPTIQRLDDFTATISNGTESDTISFDRNTTFPATLIVDLQSLQATGPTGQPPRTVQGVNVNP